MNTNQFKIKKYTLNPKGNLNAHISNLTPRQGLWLYDKNQFLVLNSASSQPAESYKRQSQELLTCYFDYSYWPELSDDSQIPADLQLNSFVLNLLEQEKKFLTDFAVKKINSAPTNFMTNTLSNFLISLSSPTLAEDLERAQEQGFETIKIKITKNFESEIKNLMKYNLKYFEVRFDFNSCLESKNIIDAQSVLKKISNIEYLEDPCPFNKSQWQKLASYFPLGFDQPQGSPSLTEENFKPENFIQFYIIKPLRNINYSHIQQLILANKRLTITNMMDSCLGTWKSYLYYCLLKSEFPKHLTTPGLYTHHFFENSINLSFLPFTGAQWAHSGNAITDFLQFLQKQAWQDGGS